MTFIITGLSAEVATTSTATTVIIKSRIITQVVLCNCRATISCLWCSTSWTSACSSSAWTS